MVIRFVAYTDMKPMFFGEDFTGVYASKEAASARDTCLKLQYPGAVFCDTEEEVEKVLMLL